MMTVNKVMLWVVAGMAVGFLFFPQQLMGVLLPSGQDEITPDMATAVLHVEGMT
jgi:hypothetical protein